MADCQRKRALIVMGACPYLGLSPGEMGPDGGGGASLCLGPSSHLEGEGRADPWSMQEPMELI